MNKKYYNKNIKLTEKPIHITIAPWSKVYKLNDIKDNKLTFPKHIGNADLEFWFKYHIAVKPKIYGIDKCFYNYRQNSESVVNNLDKHFMGYISLFNNMFDYYKNKGEQWRNLYVSYLPHLRYIEPYINELDNEKKIEITDNIINILEKINLTEEEFRKNLGFNFYKVFFRNKYIYSLFSETEKYIINKKYLFIKENIIIYKIKREIKRVIKQIKGIFVKGK